MSDFTPGPWEVSRSSSGYPYAIRAPNGNRGPGGIIDVTRWGAISMPSSPEAEANALLISAAPDLYKALEKMVSIEDGPGMAVRGWSEALDAARAALAKARGEP